MDQKKSLVGYYKQFGDSFSQKVELLTQLLGNSHHPSIGVFKENLLLNIIKNVIPNKYSVGTGFVLFPSMNDNSVEETFFSNSKHEVSNQIDILIYDSHNYAPIFKEEDFVIIKPEAVKAIIEVKGRLNTPELKDVISTFMIFGEKWLKYKGLFDKFEKELAELEKREPSLLGKPSLFLFCWNANRGSSVKAIKSETITKNLIEKYKQEKIIDVLLNNSNFPLINVIYVYNEYIVSLSQRGSNKGEISYSYLTAPGKFYKDTEGKLEGDKTISDLIAVILAMLELHYNQFISAPQAPFGDPNISYYELLNAEQFAQVKKT